MKERPIPLLVCLFCIFCIFPLIPGWTAEDPLTISVPVVYQLLQEGREIEGFIEGGTIFEPEGLAVIEAPGTESILIEYPAIDRIEGMRLAPTGLLTMTVKLDDGQTIRAYASPPKGLPLIILRDALPPGSATAGVGLTRTFTPENFQGIELLTIQAGPEIDFEALEPIATKFLEAVRKKDSDLSSQLFEQMLPMFMNEDPSGEESGETDEETTGDQVPEEETDDSEESGEE